MVLKMAHFRKSIGPRWVNSDIKKGDSVSIFMIQFGIHGDFPYFFSQISSSVR